MKEQKEQRERLTVNQEQINRICMDKYTLIGCLGHGGEGSVYLARDEHLQRPVAIKCVQGNRDCLNRGYQETDREKLIREADYLQRLGHSMLPVVYDLLGDDDGIWYLVMEYIQGTTLQEYIADNGFVAEKQARLWAEQLTDVLQYLHTRKPPVIYSDLKPDNIMVCPDGKLRLIDFGAALTLSYGADRNTAFAVTPGYGAPEQWGAMQGQNTGRSHAGSGRVDERSDIYALGKVLYYMVTGADPARPPYAALPIYEYQPLLGDGLEAIIRKCIVQEPESRYQTIEDVQKDLGRNMEGKQRIQRKAFIRVIEKKVWLTNVSFNIDRKYDMIKY